MGAVKIFKLLLQKHLHVSKIKFGRIVLLKIDIPVHVLHFVIGLSKILNSKTLFCLFSGKK